MQMAGEDHTFWPWCGLVSLGQFRNYTQTKTFAVKQAASMEIKGKVLAYNLNTTVLSPTP